MCGLRDDFGVDIDPKREMWLQLIPGYGAYRWWLVLKHYQGLQQRAGLGTVMSAARAFWLSSAWFGSAVYVNKSVNALYFFRRGHTLGGQTAAPSAPASAPYVFKADRPPEDLPRAV